MSLASLLLFLSPSHLAAQEEERAARAELLRPVRLQLKWLHQFQFAGYYVGKERGLYEEVGLDVTIVQGRPDEDPVAPVADGRAEFGIGNSALLTARGIPYVVVNPRASGIDFYGDTLFTTEAVLERDEDMVRAFRDASLRGWKWAMAHVEETIGLIRRDYAPGISAEALAWEACEIERLMLAEMVEPGYIYEGRWRHIAEGFRAAGLIDGEVDYGAFLYLPGEGADVSWLYWSLGGGAAVLIAVSAVVLWLHGLNRRLRKEIAERQMLEERLRVLADTDPLTGVMNRRRFLDHAGQELVRFRRSGRAPSLLVMDVDHFKQINDRHGHATGDETLRMVTGTCEGVIREADTLARMGGEEFAVLLRETNIEGAVTVAERLRAAMERVSLHDAHGRKASVTLSIGATEISRGDPGIDAPLARADRALYAAKERGRNCVVASAGTEQGNGYPLRDVGEN